MSKKTSLVLVVVIVVSVFLSALTAFAADRGPWAPNVSYAVNDTVTYGGIVYYCIQAHTSLTGWEPPNVPALWGPVGTPTQGGGPTATPTNTSAAPTNTPTNTSTGPTNTPTNTSVATNTPTRTNTAVGPTNTPTNTAVPGGNLALNKPVTASSVESGTSFTANLAVDGNTGTRWASAYSDPQWIRVDLGSTSTISRVVLRWEAAYGKSYQIQTSNDDVNWTNIFSTTTGDGGVDDLTGLSGSGRYVRMFGTVRATVWGYSLWELEVYGTGGPTNTPGPSPTPTNTSVGPTATRTNTPVPPTPTRTNTPVPPTPCGNCGGGLPKHVITGYWHNFNNGSTVMKLSAVPSAYNLIAVAFADATGSPGAVTFNLDPATGYAGTAEFISDINAIHSQGRKVIISVGGQNGTVSVSDSTSATNFANSIVGLMNTYGFAGVDIDLENGINATYMEQALRSIKSQKPNLIITMAPQTIDMQPGQVNGTGYFKLALNIRDILTIVNMQYYNSGSMNGCDGNVYSQGTINFLTALACIQLQAGLSPAQVGLGLPATSQAAGGGFVSPSVVNNALDCLAARTNCGSFVPAQAWPGIRGAMTWSINWDATSSYNWVNTINAHLPSVP